MITKLNPVQDLTVKGFKKVFNTSLIKNAGNHFKMNNRKYIDALGVGSIIAKDGLGCYLYVTQSLNNKEIPDDKRKFVASLDLTNGLLMILMQIAMFYTVSNKKVQAAMFDKLFGKMFTRAKKKSYQAILKNKPGFENVGKIEFTKEFEKIRGNIKDAFGGLTSLAAATIVGKRMIVPFIATPLAGKVEKRMNANDGDKVVVNNPKDGKPTPTMKGNDIAEIHSTDKNENSQTTNLIERFKKQSTTIVN